MSEPKPVDSPPSLRTQPQENSADSCSTKLPESRSRSMFVAGLALVAISFLVYPAYPIIILLVPASAIVKAGLTVTAWILSWICFSAGVCLAGFQRYRSLREPGAWRTLAAIFSHTKEERAGVVEPRRIFASLKLLFRGEHKREDRRAS
jgi:hypothetical protein